MHFLLILHEIRGYLRQFRSLAWVDEMGQEVYGRGCETPQEFRFYGDWNRSAFELSKTPAGENCCACCQCELIVQRHGRVKIWDALGKVSVRWD